MTGCNHEHDLATGNCKKCDHNMFSIVKAKPPESVADSDLKLFNCYRHASSEPIDIECDYYGETEAFINFYVDGDPVLSMEKSGISYIVLASIDQTKEYESQFQRKKNYRTALSAELDAGVIDIREYNKKIAEIESNE